MEPPPAAPTLPLMLLLLLEEGAASCGSQAGADALHRAVPEPRKSLKLHL